MQVKSGQLFSFVVFLLLLMHVVDARTSLRPAVPGDAVAAAGRLRHEA